MRISKKTTTKKQKKPKNRPPGGQGVGIRFFFFRSIFSPNQAILSTFRCFLKINKNCGHYVCLASSKIVVTIFACHSGHLRLCQQPRAAHALRSDQFPNFHSPHLFTPSGRKVSRLLCSACTTQLQCTHFARTNKKVL